MPELEGPDGVRKLEGSDLPDNGQICPVCRANSSAWELERGVGLGEAFYHVACPTCGAEWRCVYKLAQIFVCSLADWDTWEEWQDLQRELGSLEDQGSANARL